MTLRTRTTLTRWLDRWSPRATPADEAADPVSWLPRGGDVSPDAPWHLRGYGR